MMAHFLSLLSRSWDLLMSALGTTTLGVIVPLAVTGIVMVVSVAGRSVQAKLCVSRLPEPYDQQ